MNNYCAETERYICDECSAHTKSYYVVKDYHTHEGALVCWDCKTKNDKLWSDEYYAEDDD